MSPPPSCVFKLFGSSAPIDGDGTLLEVASMATLADLVPNTACANLSVEIEGRSRLLSPRLARVMVEIANLTPHGGPGFLALTRCNRDYMQVAGGGDAYVVECRQYENDAFRHYAAGHPVFHTVGWLKVLTNGFTSKRARMKS